MRKVHNDYEIQEEKSEDGHLQYRVIAPVEDDSWLGQQFCTVAIVFDKKLAYKKFKV